MNTFGQSLGTGDAFTSVLSSLKNQRKRLEVISGNISNINTIGYKSSRMTFLEMLGQTVGKIYTPFEQGTFTATGSPTDIAINGQSFFVVNDESGNQAYTRAGAFYFNEKGVLVNSNQQAVQGWQIDEALENGIASSTIGGMAAIGDVQIDPDMIENAKATENVWLSGNLDANAERTSEVWQLTEALTANGNNATETTDLNDLSLLVDPANPIPAGGVIQIGGTDADGAAITSVSFTYGTDGTTVGDLLTRINTAFDPDGAGGIPPIATAALVDGKIELTAATPGDSGISLSLTNDVALDGIFNTFPAFTEETPGDTPKATSSLILYDSLGVSHHMEIEFQKSVNNREWSWTVRKVNGNEIVNGGETGSIMFDENGAVQSFTFDDGSGKLTIDLDSGATQLNINMNINGNGWKGISQTSLGDGNVSNIRVHEQDGYASGTLQGINVDEFGFIVGTFSNGVTKKLAMLAQAEFDDPTSLEKSSASNFVATQNSGDARIGRADEFGTELRSGNLETSNVDLAEQFIQMIDAQKGYQAASRIVTTLNQILEETTRFGR